MNLEQQLLTLKKDLARATTEHDQAVGERSGVLQMLKELGYKNPGAADKELTKLQAEATQLQKEYQDKLQEVQEEYSE